jgi:8-oxo-dGTP pyrophosphatase MutT (NUDIX family)
MAAVRELFEEAGVLLAGDVTVDLTDVRRRLLANEIGFSDVLAAAGVAPDFARLHWWARWITPSAEPKRFDAHFFVAELPPGQTPSFDRQETVEELWITPSEAVARQAAGTLRLPPPQLRTFLDLAAAGDMGGILAAAAARQANRVAICPRIVAGDAGVTIIFPWDPEYEATAGEGEAIAQTHVVAGPPSRLTWGGKAWG